MNWTTVLTLWASATALLLSIGAFVVAVLSWRLSRSRSSAVLSARVSELESANEAHIARLKGLNSRLSMILLRERRRESTEPTETAAPDPEAEQQAQRDRLNSLLAGRGKP